MDPSEPPTTRPSPRRELQGPRPAPLKLRKDSQKFKKASIAPAPGQHRPPVIIYQSSPKVIHAEPSNFMTIVQSLTGASSSLSANEPASCNNSNTGGRALSAAARIATIEKTRTRRSNVEHAVDQECVESFPGILSPGPASLPTISPAYFSPSIDGPSSLNFLHDFSPAIFSSDRGFMDGNFLASPNYNFISTPTTVPSPSANWDLFNQFQEL